MMNIAVTLISMERFAHKLVPQYTVDSHLGLALPPLCQLHCNIKHLLWRSNGIDNAVLESFWCFVSVSLE